MNSQRPKVLLAMSGGVDSSVAAALLLRQGYEVIGCFMRLGSPSEPPEPPEDGAIRIADTSCATASRTHPSAGHQGCCSVNDAADARLVAAKLEVPLYICDFKQDFGRIIDYFVSEYNAGRTPNPCVRCNDWLKFGKLHAYANQIGADYVASGHYARIDRSDAARPRLLRAVDMTKDQSYVLFGVSQPRLNEMLFPLGDHRKSEVRDIALELGLQVFDKPDSQEICFVPDNNYASLLARRTPEAVTAGKIVNKSGEVLGEHQGHQHFTVGQRRGLRIAAANPLYVVDKDVETNRIVVGEKKELYCPGLFANQTNWFDDRASDREAEGWIHCEAKIRYNAQAVKARVRRVGVDEIQVRFDEPQFAVAPGQAVVCYDGDEVLCGGWIMRAMGDTR